MKKWFDRDIFWIYICLLLQALGGISYMLIAAKVPAKVVYAMPTSEGLLVSMYPVLVISGFLFSWFVMNGFHDSIRMYKRDSHRERMSLKRELEQEGIEYRSFMGRVSAGIRVDDDEDNCD